ncbi:MAG TPA: alpha/beta hydrolase [Stellaceae bacterium]|nr:alpha/beta hydrolase [Stellaceae bacterium]
MDTATVTHQFTVEDVEYLRHGTKPLLLRLYKPTGKGPFPAVVELHAGAWCHGDRLGERSRHEALAKGGLVVAALDFRQDKEGAYPRGVADINYAIRWVKAHAGELGTRPDLVAVSGQSSGGHLAMLAAMRPDDPRYTATALPAGSPAVDASVRCVAMSWPVINPLSRYKHALRAHDAGEKWAAEIIQNHLDFWGSEANMAEGSPVLLLERGEKPRLPPALWLQAPNDNMHDYKDPDGTFPGNEPARFVADYRKAGGTIDLVYFDAPLRFTSVQPTSKASLDAFARLVAFFHGHMPAAR